MNAVEVKQSTEPVMIDEIVPGSVQQVENTLIAISAVSGTVAVLARFRQPAPVVVAQAAPLKRGPKPGGKRGPGRPPKNSHVEVAPQPTVQ